MKTSERIMRLIEKHDGICHAGTLAMDLNIKVSTVKKHIKTLKNDGKVVSIKIDGKNTFQVK